MNSRAPIALFVYNRPDHTRRTLEALARNRLAASSRLIVFADGPKPDATTADRECIAATRAVVCSRPWTRDVVLHESAENRGLASSIVGGIDRVLADHDRVIVLEDDIITSPGFLEFLNRALALYADERRIMHVSAFMYPLGIAARGTVFLRVLSCWGWATWARAWRHYRADIDAHFKWLDTPERVRKFNIEGHADFYRQLLDNRAGRIRSWAVRWYASWLAQDGLSLFPTQSLVQNIGHDGSGVHCKASDRFKSAALADSIPVHRIPLRENIPLRWRINEFYRSGRVDRSFPRIWLTSRLVLPLRRRLVGA
ncbi:MAG TPA: hypothetical protein VG710_12240 [Opitutus sp.]|nr:hypothetical protein [Opitutus sp.]